MKDNMENKKAPNFINLYNAKGKAHGYWERYWDNGKLWYKGNFVDGIRHGSWERYHENGDLAYKAFYDMGNQVDYNPDEPQVTELTLDEIATKFGINVQNLKIKKWTI
jgi:antitoxin component YwqK of YwqJK toxin-antitoxin module